MAVKVTRASSDGRQHVVGQVRHRAGARVGHLDPVAAHAGAVRRRGVVPLHQDKSEYLSLLTERLTTFRGATPGMIVPSGSAEVAAVAGLTADAHKNAHKVPN